MIRVFDLESQPFEFLDQFLHLSMVLFGIDDVGAGTGLSIS